MSTTNAKPAARKKPSRYIATALASVAVDRAHDSAVEVASRRLDAEIRAIAPENLLPIGLDIPVMVTTMLGCAPGIVAYAPQLAELAHFDAGPASHIQDYAYALLDAHQHTVGASDGQHFEKKIQRATQLRGLFLAALDMLVLREKIEPAAVAEIRAGTGYRDLAGDLISCVINLRDVDAETRAHLSVSEDEMAEAMTLSVQIEDTVGAREKGVPVVGADPGLRRQQAYTLAVRAWDQVRRGLQFLRFDQGDADTIAPSLFAKGSTRRTGATEPTAPAAPAAPATPVISATNTVTSSPIPPAKNGGPFTS